MTYMVRICYQCSVCICHAEHFAPCVIGIFYHNVIAFIKQRYYVSFPLPNTFFHPMLFVLPLKYASVSHLVGQIFGTYITIRHFELFSPSQVFLVLWLLLTSCSSIVHHCTGLGFAFWNKTSRDKPILFPRLPARFTQQGYGYLWDFVAFCQLIRLLRLHTEFLFVRLRFRYPFFSPMPRDINLGSRFRVGR